MPCKTMTVSYDSVGGELKDCGKSDRLSAVAFAPGPELIPISGKARFARIARRVVIEWICPACGRLSLAEVDAREWLVQCRYNRCKTRVGYRIQLFRAPNGGPRSAHLEPADNVFPPGVPSAME
jgi:hypothetical protein